jgi:RecB family exonuclease
VKDEPIAGEFLDAREEGTLAHEALGRAFEHVRGLLSERRRDVARIVAEADRGLAALAEESTSPVLRLELERIREMVLFHVTRFAEDDEWDFVAAEQRFGGGDAWPALAISDGSEHVTFRGSIDRVDVSRRSGRPRVIDYKRSRSTVLAAPRALGDTMFQVPLYALTAQRALRAEGSTGRYLPLRPRDFETASQIEEAMVRAEADLHRETPAGPALIEHLALLVVKSIRDGDVRPAPRDVRTCDHCSARGGCRKPRFAVPDASEDES